VFLSRLFQLAHSKFGNGLRSLAEFMPSETSQLLVPERGEVAGSGVARSYSQQSSVMSYSESPSQIVPTQTQALSTPQFRGQGQSSTQYSFQPLMGEDFATSSSGFQLQFSNEPSLTNAYLPILPPSDVWATGLEGRGIIPSSKQMREMEDM